MRERRAGWDTWVEKLGTAGSGHLDLRSWRGYRGEKITWLSLTITVLISPDVGRGLVTEQCDW